MSHGHSWPWYAMVFISLSRLIRMLAPPRPHGEGHQTARDIETCFGILWQHHIFWLLTSCHQLSSRVISPTERERNHAGMIYVQHQHSSFQVYWGSKTITIMTFTGFSRPKAESFGGSPSNITVKPQDASRMSLHAWTNNEAHPLLLVRRIQTMETLKPERKLLWEGVMSFFVFFRKVLP